MYFSSYKDFFGALANETRLSILTVLRDKKACVSDICNETDLEQSRISHNLRILATWSFVDYEISGKERIYFISDEAKPFLASLDDYLEKYGEKLRTCEIISGKKTCRLMSENEKENNKN